MKKYFYSNGQDKEGPVSIEELKQIDINADTLIWFEGIQDWTPAIEIEEIRLILELNPPKILSVDESVNGGNKVALNEDNNKTTTSNQTVGLKEASQGWIIAGFVFAFLGGYLGVIIGSNYAFGNYKKETRRLGWIMVVIGIICAGVWKSIK